MDYTNLSQEELIEMLKKADAKNKELAKKKTANDAIDDELARIIEDEKMRAQTKKLLYIPEDLDPETTNTWNGSINGKPYLVPKGVEIEVPLAVYETYMAEEERKRTAIARLRAAAKKVTG